MYSCALDKYLEFLEDKESRNFQVNKREAKPQYWEFSPGKQARYWNYIYNESIMAIGWDGLGDIRKYLDKSSASKAIIECYPEEHKGKSRTKNTCWDFANEIQMGDIIIAKQGVNKTLGWGIVESDYIYDSKRKAYQSGKSEAELYPNIRKVSWQIKGSWELPDKNRFQVQSLAKINNPNKMKAIQSIFDIDDKCYVFSNYHSPDEVDSNLVYKEGAVKTVTVNAYERSPENRNACIQHYTKNRTIPIKCSICEFDFEETYGDLGKDFIHIHHITPLSEMKEEQVIDPINDLIPVCCNCHAMLHRRRNYTLQPDELTINCKNKLASVN